VDRCSKKPAFYNILCTAAEFLAIFEAWTVSSTRSANKQKASRLLIADAIFYYFFLSLRGASSDATIQDLCTNSGLLR
jgi:hypothetical protein